MTKKKSKYVDPKATWKPNKTWFRFKIKIQDYIFERKN
jgi:hypothetical protein